MRHAAQLQAAIELLDETLEERQPADRLMAQYFRGRRYIGSKDKAAISQWIYVALRQYGSLAWRAEQANLLANARGVLLVSAVLQSEDLSDLFTSERHQPRHLSKNERTAVDIIKDLNIEDAPENVQLNIPAWLAPQLKASLGERFVAEMRALQEQASVDIRCNTLKTTRERVQGELSAHGIAAEPTPVSPWGLRFAKRAALFNQSSFKNGWFEVQDEGSQLLAYATQVKPGMKVADFCAGAGGKTLAMAALMENKGVIHACDVHSKRLENLSKRTKRANVYNVQVHLMTSERDKWVKRNAGRMDVVLIDAPCTGTGTWRRSPDAKWHLNEQSVVELVELQKNILESASRLVKPGGRIIYATCSLLQEENEDQIGEFLQAHPNYAAKAFELDESVSNSIEMQNDDSMLRTYPASNQMDGFFAAQIVRLEDPMTEQTTKGESIKKNEPATKDKPATKKDRLVTKNVKPNST